MVETLKKATHHLQQIFSVSGARGVQNLDFFLSFFGGEWDSLPCSPQDAILLVDHMILPSLAPPGGLDSHTWYHFNRRLQDQLHQTEKNDQYHFFPAPSNLFHKKIFNQSSFPPSNLLLCLGDHSPDRHIFSVWMEGLDQSLHLQGNIKMFGEDWRYETPFLHNSEVYSMKRLQLKMLFFWGLEFG